MLFRGILFVLLFVSCSCIEKVSVIDTSIASVKANDLTAIIELQGCGFQPLAVVGYNFCRVKQNTSTIDTKLFFIAPITGAERHVTIYRNSGSPLSYKFPEKKTTIEVPWKDLVNADTFQAYQDQWYGVMVEINWYDGDENKRKTLMEGEIRLKVLAEGYTATPQNAAWKVIRNNHTFKITTSGRVHASDIK